MTCLVLNGGQSSLGNLAKGFVCLLLLSLFIYFLHAWILVMGWTWAMHTQARAHVMLPSGEEFAIFILSPCCGPSMSILL